MAYEVSDLGTAFLRTAADRGLQAALRPLSYRIRPVLPEPMPAATTYQIKLVCSTAAASRLRALLLATISRLPVTLQGIVGKQDDVSDQALVHAEIVTAGRHNEGIEQGGVAAVSGG